MRNILVITLLISASGAQTGLIRSPSFQIPQFTEATEYKAFLSGLVAIPETLFFFSFLFPTFVGIIFRRFIPNILVAALIGAIMASFIFTFFHFLVYGTADIIASQAVFFFGLRQCLWIYLFRSSFVCIVDHFANNFFVIYFQTTLAAIFA